MAGQELRHGRIGSSLHLCVDMQRLFAPGGPWVVPWAPKILLCIVELTAGHVDRTVFTRFIPLLSRAADPECGRATIAGGRTSHFRGSTSISLN
jgi:nicotinamidase-related amidase